MIYTDKWGTFLVCHPRSRAVAWFRRNILQIELFAGRWPWWIRSEVAEHVVVGDGWTS